MKKRTSNGRTFYRILVTLLSCVLIMAALTVFLISYQNRRSVKTHTDMLANAMTNGAAQIDGFWQNAAAFLAAVRRIFGEFPSSMHEKKRTVAIFRATVRRAVRLRA